MLSFYFWASACVCACVCTTDTDLGDTCWLVSAGIKSLEMIQLREMKTVISQKVCVRVWRCKNEQTCLRAQVGLHCASLCFAKKTKSIISLRHLRWRLPESHLHAGRWIICFTHKFLHPRLSKDRSTWGLSTFLTVWNDWGTDENNLLQRHFAHFFFH